MENGQKLMMMMNVNRDWFQIPIAETWITTNEKNLHVFISLKCMLIVSFYFSEGFKFLWSTEPEERGAKRAHKCTNWWWGGRRFIAYTRPNCCSGQQILVLQNEKSRRAGWRLSGMNRWRAAGESSQAVREEGSRTVIIVWKVIKIGLEGGETG